jgi:superfamily II DNA/RNA helicase
MKFDELGLAPEIMTAINDAGYTTPTPIQAEAIPHVIAGRDVLGIAQTGTGKTASFTLPMIHRLMKGRAKARMPRTLILEPTRELAAQVADNFDVYGKNTKLTKALLIGGVSFGDQEKAIMRGADVLIATPGRLLDHVERGGVLLRGVEVLVIDEADRMLDMGFIPDIERIVKLLPFTRQTLFFSATMPPEITRLTQQFLSAPARVEVAPPSSTNDNVSQRLISVSKTQKLKTLKKLFDEEDVTNGIIFCNRKRDIGDLLNALQKSDYPAVSLHGDMDQHMRLKMLDKFKGGEATYLIASDVAARGLDIPAVSHVFNYDVPTHAEDYVHRIGRTGRAGRKGAAITLFSKEDGKYIDSIEKLINRKIDVVKSIDTPEDVTTEKEEKAASKPPRKNDGDKKGNEKGERKGLAAFSKNKKNKKENSDAIPKASHANDKPVQKEPKTAKSSDNASSNTQVGFGENIPAFLKNAPE